MATTDVSNCCFQLNSDKVTERKKGNEQLKYLLNNSAVVAALDSNDGFSWDQVFNYTKAYFYKEARRLEDEERKKQDASQTVLSNRENQKRFAVTLPKLVLKKSSIRIPHIPAKSVLEIILKVLSKRNPYLLENYAGDFIEICIKYLLYFPQYYLAVQANQWKDLFRVCLWLYENDHTNTSKNVSIIEVMERIVERCKMRGIQDRVFVPSAVLRKLPDFLISNMKSNSHSSQGVLQSGLLRLLLTFTKIMASEWRFVVCRVGEDTLESALALWDNVPSARQTHLLEYLNLQILIHHPQRDGVFHENSSYVNDSTLWQRGLHRIYQLIHDHLYHIALKKKFAPGSSFVEEQHTIPSLLVMLAARLCHKLFQDTSNFGVLDITQTSIQSTGTQGTKSNKRRRIEIGFHPLVNMLREDGMLLHSIPWYQILTELLVSYKFFFDQEKCTLLLDLLTSILTECTLVTVQHHVIKCLNALAQQYNNVFPESETRDELRIGKWSPIWDITLRLVSGKQCSKSGLKLMQTMMSVSLVVPNASVFKLFYQGHVNINEEALATLKELLLTVPLPKSFKTESAVFFGDQVRNSRESLFQAILPVSTEGTLTALEAPFVLGHVLLMLRHRDSRCAQEELDQFSDCKPFNCDRFAQDNLKQLEELYLLSTFTCGITKKQSCSVKGMKKFLKELKILNNEEEKMIERVSRIVNQVTEHENEEPVTLEKLYLLLQMLELLFILYLHVPDERLVKHVQQTLKLISLGLRKLHHESETSRSNLLQTFKNLYNLYLQTNTWARHCKATDKGKLGVQLTKLIVKSTPTTLLDLVVEMVTERIEKALNKSPVGVSQRGSFGINSSYRGASPDSDDDFDSVSTVGMHDFMEIDENDGHESSTTQSQVNIKVEDISTYCVQDQYLLVALQWLTQASSSSLATEAELDSPLCKVIELLLKMSKSKTLELTDVAIGLHFSHALLCAEYEDDNIDDGLMIISNLARNYCHDPRVASFIIGILKDFISVNGSFLTEVSQKSVLVLSKAILRTQLTEENGHCMDESIFALNMELIKIDPKRDWSKYTLPEHDRCGEMYNLLCSPSHELRIMATQNIHLLLVKNDGTLLDSDHQDSMFQAVYQTTLEALTVQGSIPEDFKPDESCNRVATLLLTLGIIAVNSSYLETKSIFALCLAIPEHSVDALLVSKVLTKISASLNKPLKKYMRQHLPYLATQWIRHEKNIDTFPACFLECPSSTSFVQQNVDLLLPVLFENDKLEALAALSEECKLNLNELFIQNFPTLMAHILPYIAAERSSLQDQVETTKVQGAKKRYKYLEKGLGRENFISLITKHVGDITLEVVKLVHEPHTNVEEELIVTPNPPHFCLSLVQNTLTFIGSLFQNSTLATALSSVGTELHKVLIGVLEYLARSSAPHDARRALLSVSAVVDTLLSQSSGDLTDAALHTIQLLVHTLTFYISKLLDMGTYLADSCNDILRNVCKYSLSRYPEAICSVMPVLISRLLPFAKTSSKIQKSSLHVIETVLTSPLLEVQRVVLRLPPLPDDDEYSNLDAVRDYQQHLVDTHQVGLNLYEKVENFLSLSMDYVDPHVLTNLLKEVKGSRNEVKNLYKKLSTNEESLGHQLTHRLVNLTSSGDKMVSIEASKCLGELGPVSLESQVFYIKDKIPSHTQLLGSGDLEVVSQIITTLKRYLTSEPIDVVEASSHALIKILSTQRGYAAVEELEESVRNELQPLIPRHKPKATSTNHAGVDAASYKQLVEDPEKWFCHNSFEMWISDLSCLLIEAGCGSEIITFVLPVCKLKTEFCAFILPIIIHKALSTDRIGRRDALSKQFMSFFKKHLESSQGMESHNTEIVSMCMNKAALQVLLKVIDYLRAQTPESGFSNSRHCSPWERNLWLKLNYLEVAHAAYFCGAHFSALLFMEIHCEMLLSGANEMEHGKVVNRQMSRLQRVSFHPDYTSMHLLMLKVYSCIGDSDGVEGCGGGSKLLDPSARAIRSWHRGQWLNTLEIHDASHSTIGMIGALKDLRFFNTLSTVLNESSLKPTQDLAETYWESAWRLAQWDSTEINEKWEESTDSRFNYKRNFHHNLFYAFQSLHHQDINTFHQLTLQARSEIANNLKHSQAESSSSVYSILSRLQILSEVEAAAKYISVNNSNKSNSSIEELEKIWISRDMLSNIDYSYKEPIISARISTLRALAPFHEQVAVNEILHSTLLKKAVLARDCQISGSSTGCELALVSAANLNVSRFLNWKTQLEEAEVAKSQGEIHHATKVLSVLVEDMQKVELQREQEILFCQTLNLYGCVLMDSQPEQPRVIIEEYLKRAASLLEDRHECGSGKVLEESYHKLAVYGDELYKKVRDHLESEFIQSKQEQIRKSWEEHVRIRSLLENCRNETEKFELLRKSSLLKKNIAVDETMLNGLEKEREEYMYLALQNYLKCLSVSHEHDLHMYRAVALWLENLVETEVNKMMLDYGNKIKSYKFVSLLYQLVARLNCQSDEKFAFSRVLIRILERVCLEHPHHSLPVVIALAHAHADEDFLRVSSSNSNKSQQRSHQNQVIEEDRVQTAKLLISKLKKSKLGNHVSELEKVCLAYLSLANSSDGKKRSAGEKVKIPSSQPIVNLQNLSYTSALTRPVVLQPSGLYNPPIICGWDNVCTYVGGLNAPKRLTVKTSDGQSQFELLKGKDDIRQDAVLEQVFGIVNELLAKNSSTRERSLSVRTYQVVPLSQRSGLIQWCNNTQPFGEYLVGRDKKSGAHKLYYPKDYTAISCRQKVAEAKSQPHEMKYKIFKDVLDNFHPVFRHFFFENYSSPHEWYKRRLAYTRSVATNSMVGYILGLGDRHVENILLDKLTAELIHIDLGIAFDFGKILPTPETVPFRLTQDVIDGLGVMGVEGPLRHCCEATLGVLRNSGEVLVTIVEVLRHDPLYQWTLTPQQVARLQADGDEEDQGVDINSASTADRVVLRLKQKLDGIEDGYARSVPEQVMVLIQQATNVANLSQLFVGWQAYI